MNTIALSDSDAPANAAQVESTDAKPARRPRGTKKASRGDVARAGKKEKAPRRAKAERSKATRSPRAEKKPRKGRKAAAVEAPPPPAPSGEPLPMADIYPNPNQPRKLFEEKELDELAASIEQRGLLQPIKVVPRPQPNGAGKYMIVLGERRWRAHQRLGRTEILATISVLSDDEIADAAIIENLQRKDITPLEEARAYQARLDIGLTVDELAQRLGLKQSWRIAERTALLKLTAEHQDAFGRGILTPSQAYEMSHLGPAMQRVLFNAIAAGKCRSYAELRKAVEALSQREKQVEMPTETPGVEPATEAEHERVREIEVLIGKVCELVQRGFDGNEVVILRKVNPTNADVLAEKLELIEGSLKKLRLELRAGAVARFAAEAPAEGALPTEGAATETAATATAATATAAPEPTSEPAERIVELEASSPAEQTA
jgi:ParB family chromosome partitioning protein